MTNTISRTDLKAGDVLLYQGTGLIARLIRQFDGSDYSHAALYLGDEHVGEAIAEGVVARDIATSVKEANFVDVYRFRSADGHSVGDAGYEYAPIGTVAQGYLAQHEHYAYHQLILLALITTVRHANIPAPLRPIVLAIVDEASELVNTLLSAGREPMICSEFVFRCYTEAGPQYSLLIKTVQTLALAESLAPSVAPPAFGPEVTTIEDQRMKQSMHRFLTAYARAKGSANAQNLMPQPSLNGFIAGQLTDPNFVTPADLIHSPNLLKCGRLDLAAVPAPANP